MLETSSPPVYYIPFRDFKTEHLVKTDKRTVCEWKGAASYYRIIVGVKKTENASRTYLDTSPGYTSIKSYVAFYPQKMDTSGVDGELVKAHPDTFTMVGSQATLWTI